MPFGKFEAERSHDTSAVARFRKQIISFLRYPLFVKARIGPGSVYEAEAASRDTAPPEASAIQSPGA
jgi:hypothetical protein